ncbi:MAG TPA: integrase [Hyphomonas sp.]|nr:integrase [Hyphomonas sp.]
MTVLRHSDQFLLLRGERWHYHRRVPAKFKHVDPRTFVRVGLDTEVLKVARMRRDALVEADDAYWTSLLLAEVEGDSANDTAKAAAAKRYESANARAMARGFAYAPAETLGASAELADLMQRIQLLEWGTSPAHPPSMQDAEALLGAVPAPVAEDDKTTVSEAFQLYLDEIAFDEQYNKSPKQKYSWEKTKRTSINYFIDVIGDLPIAAISRDDALSYRNWWMERMIPREEGEKPAKPNTANRHIGNMRTLYEAYFSHKGDEERLNPFRKMFFKGESRVDVPPFEDDWVRSKILAPGIFDDLRWELRCIIYVLIETGCRTSEICNLLPEDIKLKANVPFIRIRPRQNREIKTETSIRDIPLVGVALEAMRAAPEGFEHYRDRGELVSANLMKAFRQRGLFPTTDHVIYSFRHAFEKRMLEAGLDYGLRCTLMGHKTDRPAYGDGGSMAYRRDELMKIAHLVPDGLKFSD